MAARRTPHRIALLFNANKGYDREVIAGIGHYLKSTRVEWDVFLEEDFRSRVSGIERWSGDGIIADFDDPEVADALLRSPLPIVAVGGSYLDEAAYPQGVPYVATDNAKLVQLGYRHLIDQGLEHFAFYGLPPAPGNRWAAERERSFVALLSQDKLEPKVYLGVPTRAGTWDSARDQLIAWLSALPKPVGVLCVTDARARQVMQACLLAGLAVPEQVAVVGIDDDPMAQLLARIALTSVRQGTEEMGRTAAHVLHQMLRGVDHSSTRIVVAPTGLHVQASSRHQPLRSAHVIRARHYIRQYGCLGVKTEQVAEYVGVSRTVLEEHFRRELKQSVHDALLQHKLEAARDLLANSSLPLAEIAVRCGFTSLQYMYTVFRREYDRTPTQFRAEASEGRAPAVS